MTDFSGATIGERVESYRRINGMTREALAEATGGSVGRDVIANIENGRRKDVTVSQLLALSSALQVPPTALIFDLSKPASPVLSPEIITHRSVSEKDGEQKETRPLTVAEALRWWGFSTYYRFDGDLLAGTVVVNQVSAWERYYRMSRLMRNNFERYQSAEELGLTTEKQRLELGVMLAETWQAYRATVEMQIEGLAEPSVPEELLDHLLEGSTKEVTESDLRQWGVIEDSEPPDHKPDSDG